jgi:hypothetical protein
MQSRKNSAVETIANIVIGYLAAVASQLLIFPAFDIAVPMRTNFIIGAWFTIMSVVRSYTVRRLFNRWEGGH